MQQKVSYIALVLAVIALAIVAVRPANNGGLAGKKETAFQRVMKSQTLRCAYISRAHHFDKDPNTGKITGVDYEVMEEIGKLLHLKIEWVEETGYGAFPEQLSSGKEDALCTAAWNSAVRAARVAYPMPIYYMPLYAYTRDGDTRFDGNIEAINDEKVTVAVIDGSAMKSVTDMSFPKAKQYALPALSENAQVVLDVATGKADLLFIDPVMIEDYNRNNPDKKLRRVEGVLPVRTYSEVFSVAMGEWELREMLNAAIGELHNNGTIERILKNYESVSKGVIRYAPPYIGQEN